MSAASGTLRTGATLAVIAAICTLLVALTHRLTAERIALNQEKHLENSLGPALAGIPYEGRITDSRLVIQPPHDLPGNDPAYVWRAYGKGGPVAALFAVTARDGYAGPIRILIGVNVDGTVTGVRILEHRETPGLGDRIDPEKSDWVFQFDGRSLGNPPVEDWALSTDGGEFDQLTGASVTPRAVLKAIRETLLYFEAHRAEIFAVEEREPASETGT